jgi:DNA-directed RNA polymerase subunit RPC12/RpoP
MDIATTIAAVSTAKDFASFIIGRKIDSAVTEKAIELQNSIIALQSGLLEMQVQIQTLSHRNRELEGLLDTALDWKAEEAEHKLISVAKGVHVIIALAPPNDERAPIWYCASCWQSHLKSVLQRTGQDYGGTHYYCPRCNSKVYDHSDSVDPSI